MNIKEEILLILLSLGWLLTAASFAFPQVPVLLPMVIAFACTYYYLDFRGH